MKRKIDYLEIGHDNSRPGMVLYHLLNSLELFEYLTGTKKPDGYYIIDHCDIDHKYSLNNLILSGRIDKEEYIGSIVVTISKYSFFQIEKAIKVLTEKYSEIDFFVFDDSCKIDYGIALHKFLSTERLG